MFIIQDCSPEIEYLNILTETHGSLFNVTATAQSATVLTRDHNILVPSSPRAIRYDISVAVVAALDFILNCILLQVLCLCGVVGNALNIVILSRHGCRKPTNILLTSLSVSDLLFSVTQSLSRTWSIVARFDLNTALTLNSMYVVYVRSWNEAALTISIYQVTMIALVRLLAVCCPLHVHRIFTPLRVKFLTCAIYIILVVLHSPIQVMYEIRWVPLIGNATVAAYQPSHFYVSHTDGVNFYIAAILSNARSSVPLTTVSVCSIIIILRLSISNKLLDKQSDSIKKKARSIKSVKMLLTICFSLMFLVLVPTTTFEAYISFGPDKAQLSCRLKIVVLYLSNILFQFSCSVNFVVYVTMNSKFAKTYKQLFCSNQKPSPQKRKSFEK
ncbi:neuropeptides capa receptor [Biomphalaria pfeifferi]|uniref:Neuropeptides capa receptor n=1 Tax=Biomphalaria pfeifferi TaxID=112525 RepID=A0AAD8BTG9_BIOPF|nr:neuropeptides capa receptor [Biomphalaria pfeifferi]